MIVICRRSLDRPLSAIHICFAYEVSLVTILTWVVILCDWRVLFQLSTGGSYVLILSCVILCIFPLWYMWYYFVPYWVRNRGSKLSCETGGSSLRYMSGGSDLSCETRGSSLRHMTGGSSPRCMTGGSMPSYSHERIIICVCGILGNSLSFVLIVLCDMCFRYFSGSREGANLIVHTS